MMRLRISEAKRPHPPGYLRVAPDCPLEAISVQMGCAHLNLPVGTSIQDQFTLLISQTTHKGKKTKLTLHQCVQGLDGWGYSLFNFVLDY